MEHCSGDAAPGASSVPDIEILGHRANTPRWIAKFFREGASGVEVDVFCRSGRLYAGHMGAPHGLRLLREKIAMLIMSLHLTGPYPLERLLDEIPSTASLMLDLKSTPFDEHCIQGLLDAHDAYRRVYIPTRDYQLARRLARSGATVLLSMDHRPLNPIRDLEEAGAAGVSINYCYLDRELAERLLDAGAVIVAWTVNKPEAARAMAGLGVEAIVSDFPGVVRRALGNGASRRREGAGGYS